MAMSCPLDLKDSARFSPLWSVGINIVCKHLLSNFQPLHTLTGPQICSTEKNSTFCRVKVKAAWVLSNRAGIVIFEKCFFEGSWYLGSKLSNICLNPCFSTIEIGSISFTMHRANLLVNCYHFFPFLSYFWTKLNMCSMVCWTAPLEDNPFLLLLDFFLSWIWA